MTRLPGRSRTGSRGGRHPRDADHGRRRPRPGQDRGAVAGAAPGVRPAGRRSAIPSTCRPPTSGSSAHLLGTDVSDRREASHAAHALGIGLGCRVLRAHDVRGARRTADVLAAVLAAAGSLAVTTLHRRRRRAGPRRRRGRAARGGPAARRRAARRGRPVARPRGDRGRSTRTRRRRPDCSRSSTPARRRRSSPSVRVVVGRVVERRTQGGRRGAAGRLPRRPAAVDAPGARLERWRVLPSRCSKRSTAAADGSSTAVRAASAASGSRRSCPTRGLRVDRAGQARLETGSARTLEGSSA